MNLSLRLEEIIDTVENCDTAVDVGCDHGFVSIDIVKKGKAQRVIACDINKGPLKAAALNIKNAGVEGFIETRLSDGLSKVSVSDKPDAVIIAGMGGSLITRILDEGKEVLGSVTQLILSPQSEIFLVRKWLRENGYTIMKEKCVFDANKYYFIMDVRVGKSETYEASLQEIYDTYSEYLIKTKDRTLREFLQKGLDTNLGILATLDTNKRETLQSKTEMIKAALKLIDG